MRLLALDISTNPGFAVLDVKQLKNRVKLTLVHVSSLRTSTENTDGQRYAYIEAATTMIAHEYGPFDKIIREHFTKGRDKRATQTVFGAWSAIDMALNKYGYKTDIEITPSAVKKLVTEDGSADKKKVEEHVRQWLSLDDDFVFKWDDQSDACAIGLAYLIREGVISK